MSGGVDAYPDHKVREQEADDRSQYEMLVSVDDSTIFVHHRRRGRAAFSTSRFLGRRVVEEAVAFTNVLRAPGA
ncbi:hypothetical protein D7252_15030 [Microbacterium sp. CGR2]|nr:hypothetical protein D7252_15030 [Microbacterium sp. CGR2]